MRRADRLFQIVQLLRGGRLVTAAKLAERLEVSERTVYRDVSHLQMSGVPIEGEAGIGYVLRQGFELPPLMFTREELVALVAGARLVQAWGGAGMARAAEEALVKIDAVLPDTRRNTMRTTEIHAVCSSSLSPATRELLDELERAVDEKCRLRISYADAEGKGSHRVVRPLGLWFWGKVWTLAAWCELRNAHRLFRVDRIQKAQRGEGHFSDEKGKTLRDLLSCLEREEGDPSVR